MHSASKSKVGKLAAMLATVAVILVLATSSVQAANKSAKKIPSSGPFTLDFLTLYGFFDNSPPGTDIAHPVIHSGAGGKGTFADPITFAVAPQVENVMKPGTKIYIPSLQKYFIMEDDCTSSGPGGPGVQGDGCDGELKKGVNEFDLWIGATNKGDNPGGKASNSQMSNCEDRLTANNVPIIIKPASNLTVNTTPLLNHGHCIK
jgi:hypothetical protein